MTPLISHPFKKIRSLAVKSASVNKYYFTVILHFEVFPLKVFTVIVALPLFFAFITPLELTVAIFLLLDVNVILLEYSPFLNLAFTVNVFPFLRVFALLFRVIFVGAFFTVRTHLACLLLKVST